MRLIPDPFEKHRSEESVSRHGNPCGMYIGLCDTEDIFRDMAIAEIRRGNLHRMRRYRLVRYAAMLNISAADAGRIMSEAHEIVLDLQEQENHPDTPLRLVSEEHVQDRLEWPLWVKLSLVLAFLSMVYAAFIK